MKVQSTRDSGQPDCLSVASGAEAAQLMEFALAIPLLAVLVVGVIDFGTSWVLKDRMANAARDGARVAVSAPNDTFIPSGQCGSTPCSAQSAASAAVNYLSNAGLSACGLDPSSTAPTNGPGAFGWTYTSPKNCPGTAIKMSIVVERTVTPGPLRLTPTPEIKAKRDVKVWAVMQTGLYYCPDSRLYQKIDPGMLMTQETAASCPRCRWARIVGR